MSEPLWAQGRAAGAAPVEQTALPGGGGPASAQLLAPALVPWAAEDPRLCAVWLTSPGRTRVFLEPSGHCARSLCEGCDVPGPAFRALLRLLV